MRYNFRPLSVPSPRNNVTKYPLLPPNTLTPVPRNNVARYMKSKEVELNSNTYDMSLFT